MRNLSPLITGDRRDITWSKNKITTISSSNTDKFSYNVDYESTCEIDNHADTTCFGPNFRVTYVTDQECNVYPFTDQYKPIQSIPIVTACTAYDDPVTGESYILEFNQGLYFGHKMKHSLICPNQCRVYGIDICDDPYDKHRDIGLEDPITQVKIPFEMVGTFATFRSRVPRDNELRDCMYITMTSDNPWIPSDFDKSVSTVVKNNIIMDNNEKYNRINVLSDPCEIDNQLGSISSIYSSVMFKQEMRSVLNISSAKSRGRSPRVTADELSKKMGY